MAHTSVTQGVKLGPPRVNLVSRVKPAGDLTPARPVTAASLGFASPVTKRAAEAIYWELELTRIQRGMWRQRGRPELAGNELGAAPAFG